MNCRVRDRVLTAIHSLLLHRSYGLGTLVGLEEMPFWVRKIKG